MIKDILLMLSTVKRLDSNLKRLKVTLEIIDSYPKFGNAYLNLSDLYFDKKLLKKAKKMSPGISIDHIRQKCLLILVLFAEI